MNNGGVYMDKEKPRKESNPLDEANFTGTSAGAGMNNKNQQKKNQNSAQNNESGTTNQ
jgi:hypothetical protein